jgi:preprotein translocase subunit SecD
MNRYPVWKYAVILIVLLVSVLFALPNFFGEAPAVQVSSAKSTIKVDSTTQIKIEEALKTAGLAPDGVTFDGKSIKALFKDTDTQLKAKDAIQKSLIPNVENPNYVVALNLVRRSPAWLNAIGAAPMYLGLDLRGGIHLLMQVDMAAALSKKTESMSGDIRTSLRDKNIRHSGISRNGLNIEIRFRDQQTLTSAKAVITDQFPELQMLEAPEGTEFKLTANIKQDSARKVQDQALKQNMVTINNRINELAVADPVIQQQGLDRIVVQLPGIQNPDDVIKILGRTATLEIRMVDESSEGQAAESNSGSVPFGSERFLERNGRPVIVKKQVILTGENLTDAQAGIDSQTQGATVNLSLDAKGSRIFADVTKENINKRMAILLFEKGKGEVVTAPVIRSEIGGGRVQISGSMNTTEANETALLLRAGSLAAPMEIIEQSAIGPSLGKENIDKGFDSVTMGFLVIVFFMCVYYMMFGVFSSLALGVNLLMLVAVLSMLQATLTLPGIAAMALALGMAIDSNVLINERVREELRGGASPQAAIATGFDRAWATILDSNITTLIAGVALLAFGSGTVRGFAVVHCIGILTSMFSAVFFSRGLVNLWYGRQKKLKSVSIGTVWVPDATEANPSTSSTTTK